MLLENLLKTQIWGFLYWNLFRLPLVILEGTESTYEQNCTRKICWCNVINKCLILHGMTSLMRTTFLFRYHGSLTAPPCTENVIWTVFKLPVMITLKQLDDFERILSGEGLNGSDGITMTQSRSFRGIQPKNDRIIYENFAGVASRLSRKFTIVKASSFTFLLIWLRFIWMII